MTPAAAEVAGGGGVCSAAHAGWLATPLRRLLEWVRDGARAAGLEGRITMQPCATDTLGELPPADAALAFWMVHEVPDVARFLGEVAGALKRGGRFLLVEPRGHVSGRAFAATVELATAAGLRPTATSHVRLSRTTMFEKG